MANVIIATWGEWHEVELVKVSDHVKYNGLYWKLKIRATKTDTPGRSRVEWELWKGGKDASPTQIPYWLTWEINGISYYTDEYIVKNGNSSQQPHCNYTSANNTTPTFKGNFEVTHSNEGTKQFQAWFEIDAQASSWTTWTGEKELDLTMPANFPQTPCYWDNNSFVKTNKTFVAPNGRFKVEWGGAKGGVANAIKEFEISCKIGDEVRQATELAEATSYEFDFSSKSLGEDARGKIIEVSVGIVGTSISTSVVKSTTAYVNVRPDSLNIIEYSGMNTGNIFSYELSSVQFRCAPLTKTGKPESQPDQQLTLQIEVDEDGKWGGSIPSLNSWDKGTSKTFKFRVTDGEENSEESGPYVLTRNWNFSESLSLAVKEGSSYAMTATLPTAPGTFTPYQNYSAIATLFNGENKLKSLPFSTSSDFDIRSLFLEDLKSSETYENLKVVLTCTDGVDEASKSIQDLSINVPAISIVGTYIPDGQEGPWSYYQDGVPETVQLSSSPGTDWAFAGIDTVGPGESLQRIKMHGSENYGEFYVETANSITAIKDLALDFELAGGNIYKPYSATPTFSSSIEDYAWQKYGLTSAPEMTFWFDERNTVITQATKASSDNTISCQISGTNAYNIANAGLGYKTGDKKTLYYSYTNVYNTVVTQTATTKIELDYREDAQVISDSWYICANPGEGWNSDYAIENWSCIKEDMPLSTNIEIVATTEPTAWLERGSDEIGWLKFYEFTVAKNGETTDENKKFNIRTPIYVLNSYDKIKEISQGANDDKIRLVVKTDSTENLEVVYKNETFTFARHVAPLAKFTSVSYSNGIITGNYEILDAGTNVDGYEQIWRLKIQGAGLIDESEEYKFSYDSFESTYIYVAPVLTTTLFASITIRGEERTAFEKSKTTKESAYEYIICYNISPTVAYRSNYLGINTSNPQEDSVLDINAYNSQQIIYLRGPEDRTIMINLLEGSVSGAIVDCGSWDNTPGGIIPSPNQPSGGSQYIEDMLQRDGNELVFIAGGAPSA